VAVPLLRVAGWGGRGSAQAAGAQGGSASDDIANRRMLLPSVSFRFELAGLAVPRFTLTIFSDATGMYEGEQALVTDGRVADPAVPPQLFHRELTVTPALAGRVLKTARELNHFKMECETKAKNMAETGRKTLTYSAPDGAGSCTYNYSDDERVQGLTAIFRGLAETMDEGRRLDYLHRFDRLGLDAELELLSQEVSEGSARELETIAPSLRSIASDPEVMQRVRARAGVLLATVPDGQGQGQR
jgi:hypothetical protein